MRPKRILMMLTLAVLAFSAVTLIPNKAVAHCDTMNGPVVKAAQKALETGNVDLVLETLVRIHRAGEGAPYTGLKAALSIDQATRGGALSRNRGRQLT